MKVNKFIAGVEKLVDPITVGTLHFMQGFNNNIPVKLQRKMIEKSSAENPLMSFVVDPYGFYIGYQIIDLDYFKQLIPDGFKLIKTKMFEQDEEQYYFILGVFNARTSGFMGARVEAYVICEDERTGLTSWVIIDYDTNTISYDPKNGLVGANCPNGYVTTTYEGKLQVEMGHENRNLRFTSDLLKGKSQKLNQKLWIEGNLSVAYGKNLADDIQVFALQFVPEEMQMANEIALDTINIIENSWYRDMISEEPIKIACFPYAQHFLSDAPYHRTILTNELELKQQISKIDFKQINVYSVSKFRQIIIFVPLILVIIIILLIII